MPDEPASRHGHWFCSCAPLLRWRGGFLKLGLSLQGHSGSRLKGPVCSGSCPSCHGLARLHSAISCRSRHLPIAVTRGPDRQEAVVLKFQSSGPTPPVLNGAENCMEMAISRWYPPHGVGDGAATATTAPPPGVQIEALKPADGAIEVLVEPPDGLRPVFFRFRSM